MSVSPLIQTMLMEYVATFDNNNIFTFTIFCTDNTTDIGHFQLIHFHSLVGTFWIIILQMSSTECFLQQNQDTY